MESSGVPLTDITRISHALAELGSNLTRLYSYRQSTQTLTLLVQSGERRGTRIFVGECHYIQGGTVGQWQLRVDAVEGGIRIYTEPTGFAAIGRSVEIVPESRRVVVDYVGGAEVVAHSLAALRQFTQAGVDADLRALLKSLEDLASLLGNYQRRVTREEIISVFDALAFAHQDLPAIQSAATRARGIPIVSSD